MFCRCAWSSAEADTTDELKRFQLLPQDTPRTWTLQMLMGYEAVPRRLFIEQNAKFAGNLDI